MLFISTERIIEDHEVVIEVQSKWGIEEGNRLYFRKNYAKYEFFKNPVASKNQSVYLFQSVVDHLVTTIQGGQ